MYIYIYHSYITLKPHQYNLHIVAFIPCRYSHEIGGWIRLNPKLQLFSGSNGQGLYTIATFCPH